MKPMPSNRLNKPAIVIIIAGSILALTSLFNIILLSGMLPTYGGDSSLVRAGALLLGIVSFILSGFMVYGGVQMLRKSQYIMCLLGAIAAIFGGICQFGLGVIPASILISGLGILFIAPSGIWSFVELRKSDNKNLFLGP